MCIFNDLRFRFPELQVLVSIIGTEASLPSISLLNSDQKFAGDKPSKFFMSVFKHYCSRPDILKLD